MIEREKRQDESSPRGDDAAAEFVRDFAEGPPPKSIEVVKAASDTVHKVDKSKRAQRVRDLAYRLWEENGRPEGRQDDFWHQADAEINGPDSEAGKSDAGK